MNIKTEAKTLAEFAREFMRGFCTDKEGAAFTAALLRNMGVPGGELSRAHKSLESGPTFETRSEMRAKSGYSITCKRCGLTSYHPDDVSNRYCGHCHIFHDDLTNTPPQTP